MLIIPVNMKLIGFSLPIPNVCIAVLIKRVTNCVQINYYSKYVS